MLSLFRGRLYAAAGESDGGGAAVLTDPQNIRVDAGVPHEVDGEPDAKPAPAKKEDPNDARFKGIEKELETTRRQLAEVTSSERYWADQARRRTDSEDDDTTGAGQAVVEDTPVAETAEQFLDDVSKRGMKAIKERGFMTKAEVAQMVAEGVAEANQNLDAARRDVSWDSQLASEFPEIAADYRLIEAGKKPTSVIFARSAEIFRETVRMDPSLKTSKSALIMAARTAKAQLAAEGKGEKDDVTTPSDGENSRQAARRDRIDRQRADRGIPSAEEGDGSPTLTEQQKQVMKHLKVDEASFVKNSDGARAGGRRGR